MTVSASGKDCRRSNRRRNWRIGAIINLRRLNRGRSLSRFGSIRQRTSVTAKPILRNGSVQAESKREIDVLHVGSEGGRPCVAH
jgi:hypothetical protein